MKDCKMKLIVNGKLIFPIVILLLLASCEAKKTNAEETQVKGYVASPSAIKQSDIQISASVVDNLKEGILLVSLQVQNHSDEKVIVDYINCSLSLGEDRVVIPETKKLFKSELEPGDAENYEIYFQPINSIDYYYRTGYRGDMRQTYDLNLDFVTDQSGKQLLDKAFSFTLSDSAYQAYMVGMGKDKDLLILDFDFENEAFSLDQKAYFEKIFDGRSGSAGKEQLPIDDSFYALSPAITIQRRILNMLVYAYKDTLTVDMRLVNQDPYNLKIDMNELRIVVEDQVYNPFGYFTDSFETGILPENPYIFKSGTRVHLKCKFVIPIGFERCIMKMDWLTIDANAKDLWVNLLHRDLSFKAVSSKL